MIFFNGSSHVATICDRSLCSSSCLFDDLDQPYFNLEVELSDNLIQCSQMENNKTNYSFECIIEIKYQIAIRKQNSLIHSPKIPDSGLITKMLLSLQEFAVVVVKRFSVEWNQKKNGFPIGFEWKRQRNGYMLEDYPKRKNQDSVPDFLFISSRAVRRFSQLIFLPKKRILKIYDVRSKFQNFLYSKMMFWLDMTFTYYISEAKSNTSKHYFNQSKVWMVRHEHL